MDVDTDGDNIHTAQLPTRTIFPYGRIFEFRIYPKLEAFPEERTVIILDTKTTTSQTLQGHLGKPRSVHRGKGEHLRATIIKWILLLSAQTNSTAPRFGCSCANLNQLQRSFYR